MLFRTLIYNKVAKSLKETLELQKEIYFSEYHTEEATIEARKSFEEKEAKLKANLSNSAKACDVADIVWISLIVQIICHLNDFTIGTYITRLISILALLYSIFKIDSFPRWIYTIPIVVTLVPMLFEIFN